ncbi:MAG: RluA family pseudouridine synthase [Planctomycetaceae bacterium]|nr:RluA family pseudouridine synthase [Planctomycetaceae bacterium]
MPLVTKSATLNADSPLIGRRIDHIVQELVALSRSQVTGLFDHGCVRVNGAICTQPAQRLAAGDRVEVKYDASQRYHPKPKPRRNLGFEIVFEDKHLIVVNKPADLLTVPTVREETNTLQHKVAEYVKHVSKGRAAFTVHRLDRGVSGLLVLGKTQEIVRQLKDQFAASKPEREYLAIVSGLIEKASGTFESLLATDKDLNRFSTEDEKVGQLAITHYRVVSVLEDTTLVQVRLETGRRNQIRVHFAEAGHPVLGDPRYRPEQAAHRHWPHKRLALHARLLGFEHPVSGQELRFEAALPEEMERFLKGVKRK